MNSRIAPRLLSILGEGLATVGILAGVGGLVRRQQFRLYALIGLALSLLGLILFLPATLSLLFNVFFGLLDFLN